MEIIAYDKYKSGFQTKYVQEVTLNKIFEKSDFVSLHTPNIEILLEWLIKIL